MATDPGAFTLDAMLADSAVAAEGKLYVQGGGWHTLTSSAFPFKQPRMAIAVVIGVPYTETNRNHKMEISLEGEDGPMPLGRMTRPDGEVGEVMMIGSQFNVGRPAHLPPGDKQPIPMAMNIDQVKFEQPGTYSFVLRLDDQEVNRLSFRVAGPPAITMGR